MNRKSTMNFTRLAIILSVVGALAGCAHPMVISPDISKIQADAGVERIKKNVGYYIPDAQRNAEVTTPGGGGDKVTYHPYKDTETAIYKMLGNVFASVTQLKSASDSEAIARNHLSFVILPDITTNSSSKSAVTWPPTDFTFALTCVVVDAAGKPVGTYTVNENGHAEFSEFKKDFSLAGKLASEQSLLQMQKKLLAAPELRE